MLCQFSVSTLVGSAHQGIQILTIGNFKSFFLDTVYIVNIKKRRLLKIHEYLLCFAVQKVLHPWEYKMDLNRTFNDRLKFLSLI